MPFQPQTLVGSAHRPAFPSPGTAAPWGPGDGTDSGISQTWAHAHPPSASCGLWTQHFIYWGAGFSLGRWGHSAPAPEGSGARIRCGDTGQECRPAPPPLGDLRWPGTRTQGPGGSVRRQGRDGGARARAGEAGPLLCPGLPGEATPRAALLARAGATPEESTPSSNTLTPTGSSMGRQSPRPRGATLQRPTACAGGSGPRSSEGARVQGPVLSTLGEHPQDGQRTRRHSEGQRAGSHLASPPSAQPVPSPGRV